MAKPRASTSKTSRRVNAKRSTKRSTKRMPAVVAPVDYAADYAATTVDYSSSPTMDEESYSSAPSSSSPSMIDYVLLLLQLAALAYACVVVYDVWVTPETPQAGSATSADAILANKYAYLALTLVMGLITLFVMYKMFVSP